MSMSISRIVAQLEPSATLAMAAKAKELKAAGKTVFDFSVGEPDFTTPEHICRAATEAMKAGHTHYTMASGIPELRTAIARHYEAAHGLVYSPQQVVVSNGAKHSLHNVFTALCNPGDEVIIPAPYWVSYAELVKLTGAVPVIVETSQAEQFKLTPAKLRAAITPRTTILLVCSPSNPTGSMYASEELAALADVVVERNLVVVADEIYERLVYGNNRFTSFATVRPKMQERTVLVNGASKAYAMTGWRIGWTLSPAPLAKAMADLQSQETSNPVEHQPVRGTGGGRGAARMRDHDAGRICQAARVRARTDRRDRGALVPRHGRRVLRVRQYQGPLGTHVRRQAGQQFDRVVPGAARAAERGHRDGLVVWRRGLRADFVCHWFGDAESRFRPNRIVFEKLTAGRFLATSAPYLA